MVQINQVVFNLIFDQHLLSVCSMFIISRYLITPRCDIVAAMALFVPKAKQLL
jgi:hypothetical protein